MRVWDESTEPDSLGALQFDAAEFGVPQLGFIVENVLIQHALLNVLAGLDGGPEGPGTQIVGHGAEEGRALLQEANRCAYGARNQRLRQRVGYPDQDPLLESLSPGMLAPLGAEDGVVLGENRCILRVQDTPGRGPLTTRKE